MKFLKNLPIRHAVPCDLSRRHRIDYGNDNDFYSDFKGGVSQLKTSRLLHHKDLASLQIEEQIRRSPTHF
jgi:hypothetical protein